MLVFCFVSVRRSTKRPLKEASDQGKKELPQGFLKGEIRCLGVQQLAEKEMGLGVSHIMWIDVSEPKPLFIVVQEFLLNEFVQTGLLMPPFTKPQDKKSVRPDRHHASYYR